MRFPPHYQPFVHRDSNTIMEKQNIYAFYFLNMAQRDLYHNLRNAVSENTQYVPVRHLSVAEINTTIKALLTDSPEFFWFEGKWTMDKMDNQTIMLPVYTYDSKTRLDLQHAINDEITKIIISLPDSASLYERYRHIFDWIVSNVKYDMSLGYGQTACDALIGKHAVCKGISKSFQLILEKMNCFSTLQGGTLDGKARHVWNVVEIDRNYYNVDVCMGYEHFSYLFDESQRNNRYRCFVVSDASLAATHRLFPMPWPSLDCKNQFQGVN